jgi:shikimate kinase
MTVRVVLVGLPGAGKTSVGAALARSLGVGFVDLDDEVARVGGRTPGEILRIDGEAAFREIEASVLVKLLAGAEDTVLAAGGGVVETPAARAALRVQPLVVRLVAPVDLLAARVAEGDRPLLGADPATRLAELAVRRDGWYAEVADVEIDSSRPIDDVVSELAALVVLA